jgi:hypothetical protein
MAPERKETASTGEYIAEPTVSAGKRETYNRWHSTDTSDIAALGNSTKHPRTGNCLTKNRQDN